MVDLVLKRTRQKVGPFPLVLLPGAVQALDDRAHRPHDRGVETGKAQAALFLELHAVARDKLRVDHDDQPRRVAAQREIHDEDPKRHPNLRGCETHSRRGVHRLDHVVDELLDLGGNRINPASGLDENAVAVLENGSNHNGQITTNNAETAEIAEQLLFRKVVDNPLDAVSCEPLHVEVHE